MLIIRKVKQHSTEQTQWHPYSHRVFGKKRHWVAKVAKLPVLPFSNIRK